MSTKDRKKDSKDNKDTDNRPPKRKQPPKKNSQRPQPARNNRERKRPNFNRFNRNDNPQRRGAYDDTDGDGYGRFREDSFSQGDQWERMPLIRDGLADFNDGARNFGDRRGNGNDGFPEDFNYQQWRQEQQLMPPEMQSTSPFDHNPQNNFNPVIQNETMYGMPQFNSMNPMVSHGISMGNALMDMPPNSMGLGNSLMDMPSNSMGFGSYAFGDADMRDPKVSLDFLNCALVPPPLSARLPARRTKPPGCKTVFVGGLPKMATSGIVREAFRDCGEIEQIRMSKKGFCHIRFRSMDHVERAMQLSGYCLKVENKDDPQYSAWIHVDYAIAHSDQHDYECEVRAIRRSLRHANNSPSPPPMARFTEREASAMIERLHDDDTIKPAIDAIVAWMEKGECSKKNAGSFYSMIQSIFSNVRRLEARKTNIEDELEAVKQKLQQQCASNGAHFRDIEKAFHRAMEQKVWDHFTKAQRKNVKYWYEQMTSSMSQNSKDLLEERIEADMEVSDEEAEELKKDATKQLEEEIQQLKNTNQQMGNVYQENQRLTAEIEQLRSQLNTANASIVSTTGCVTQNDARLVSFIHSYLNIHPMGENVNGICSYLIKFDRSVNAMNVENVLKKFHTIFKEESIDLGNGAFEKRWVLSCDKFFTSSSSVVK